MSLTTFGINTLEENDTYFDVLNELYLNEDKPNPDFKKKIYIAGPWFDAAALQLCKFVENTVLYESQYRHEVFCPRIDSNSNGQTPKEVFDLNVQHVSNADVIIAMISRKDTGTAWEIGMAYAQGKEIILLGYDDTDFTGSKTNTMLAMCGKGMTLAKLVKYLRGNMTDDDWVQFDNNWEVVE